MALKLLFICFVAVVIQQVRPIKVPILGDVLNGLANVFNLNQTPVNEDVNLNITQLAAKYNYSMEDHKVTTEDGYILTVHRLGERRGVPILLMHGLLDSSDSWLLQGPNNSLGYLLAEAGFDVWMGNARGNKYSFSHIKLNARDERFWNFTWEQIGLYDLPATVDYILNETNSKELYYVGFSQGTTTFYVMNALKPEYSKKVKMMFSLAPVAWLRNIREPLLKYMSRLVGYAPSYNLYTSSKEFFTRVCGIFSNRCSGVTDIFTSTAGLVDKDIMPVIFSHYPTTASALQFIHYAQLINSGRFCRFDYGKENMAEYGTVLPPEYDLSELTTPVVLYYSNGDSLSTILDVLNLGRHLPNVYKTNIIRNISHMDFIYATIAKEKIYKDIIMHIRQLEKN
ncbi:unnamed protein product [Leptosia nina]|uniref:Lipase n=1 Tax=Leptosia nina TaxID=320188 RepID=A0AAV1K3R4_9NEOP